MIAQSHLEQDKTYSDFTEHFLVEELKAKAQCTRAALLKFAGFPHIKILEEYDFKFASSAPKAQLHELAGLSFIHRQENVVLLAPSGVGKNHLGIFLGVSSSHSWHQSQVYYGCEFDDSAGRRQSTMEIKIVFATLDTCTKTVDY